MTPDGPDMSSAAQRRQQPRPAAELQGRDPVDPSSSTPAAPQQPVGEAPAYVQHIYRLQSGHDRTLRRMHDKLGFRSKQDTLRWILDNLCEPWLDGRIEAPQQRRKS